ncbi:MAG: aminodeoxychorismate synthase, component I, partial [Gammaproteobacteria bacterium]|nr:aminodeoxychorismate synthase, component I [Gammaproteobacteria bacterium]
MTPTLRRIDPSLDLLQLQAEYPERYPFLLESAAAGTPHGRFDILFALPQHSLWLGNDRKLHGAPEGSHDFLDALDRLWR